MSTTRIDLETFAVKDGKLAQVEQEIDKTAPRYIRGQQFVSGPLPWDWMLRAMGLPGKALAVGLFLWFRAGILKQRTIKICPRWLLVGGIQRKTVYRGLNHLESAGLVSVDRRDGSCPVVTILEVQKPA